MPYVRGAYRRNRFSRRRYRNRNRRLSTVSVLTKKGATSQALQINALNKKVNSLSRSIKPDMKLLYYGPGVDEFSNSALDRGYKIGWYGAVAQGQTDSQRLGDKIFIRSFKFFLTANYWNNAEVGSNFDDEAAQLRIIFFQCRSRVQYNESGLTPANFLQAYSSDSDSAGYLNIPITPLLRDITERYDILKDFSVSVSRYYPHKQVKVHIPLKRRTLRFDGTSNVPDRGIGFIVIGSGMNYQNQTSERIRFTDSAKIVFTESRKK